MANILKPKSRITDATPPTTESLADGEIAVNSFSKRIYQRVGTNIITLANYFSGAWADITGKPTTLEGYGITDAALNNAVVHLTGTETIGGSKTFTSGVAVNSLTVGATSTASVGIELGGTAGVATTPFIDFHSGATATDYDARIIAAGGNGTTGGGSLRMIAANLYVGPAGTNSIWYAGNPSNPTTLAGYGITDAQGQDATLTALAGLSTGANLIPYFTGTDAASLLTLSTDATLAANSDTTISSQKALKSYIDGRIAAADAMVFKGVIDCSTNPNYPLADRGWTYRVSVAGKIGGASGLNVEVGDILICATDGAAAGNHATVGAQWAIIQANIDGSLTAANIGVTVQAYDAGLTSLAGVTTAANKSFYTTGVDVFATYDLSAGGRALSNVAGTANTFPYFSAANVVSLQAITAQGRALLDDPDQTTMRATLGLGTAAISNSLDFATATHKYHAFFDEQYFFDNYEQANNFRLFTELSAFDQFRFCLPTNVEFWDYDAGTPGWFALAGGDALIKNILDGREETGWSIPHANRTFRFELNRVGAWPTTALVVLQSYWSGQPYTSATVTIETWNGTAWVVKSTSIFGAGTTGNNYGIHAKAEAGLHDGIVKTRVTVDITDWVDSGAYTTFPLRRLMLISNYTGQTLEPWSWNWNKEVKFAANPYVNTNVIWHAGNFNPASKLDVTAAAASATKLATARTINGVSFDGTANITISAAADWSTISNKPNSLSGYGITNAYALQSDLGSTADLNAITTPGIYHQPLNSSAATGANYPAAVAGMLHVYASGAMVYQTYQRYNTGARWHRSYYSTTWGPWLQSWDSGNFDPSTKANVSTTTTTDTAQSITGYKTFSAGVGGVEGGEFGMAKPASGTSLTGNVNVDINGNALRVIGVNGTATGYGGIIFDVFGQNGAVTGWHSGNFDPAGKVNVAQVSTVVDPNALGGTLSQGIVTSPAGNAPSAYTTIWNLGANGNRDGQFAWYYGSGTPSLWFRSRHDTTGNWNSWVSVFHSGNFNPATKADTTHNNLRASLNSPAPTITDWNSVTENGWAMAAGAANAPGGSVEWFMGHITRHNALWIQQELFQFTNVAQTLRWRRHLMNGTWGAWTAQERASGDGNPTASEANNALTLYGSYGGGLSFIDNTSRAHVWMQGDPSLRFGLGTAGGAVTEYFRIGGATQDDRCVFSARGWFRYVGATAGCWYSNTADTRTWFVGSKDDATWGVYNTTNSWSWVVGLDGRPQIKNANSAALSTQPRIFITGTDPGAAAADGDLWIW